MITNLGEKTICNRSGYISIQKVKEAINECARKESKQDPNSMKISVYNLLKELNKNE